MLLDASEYLAQASRRVAPGTLTLKVVALLPGALRRGLIAVKGLGKDDLGLCQPYCDLHCSIKFDYHCHRCLGKVDRHDGDISYVCRDIERFERSWRLSVENTETTLGPLRHGRFRTAYMLHNDTKVYTNTALSYRDAFRSERMGRLTPRRSEIQVTTATV